MQNALHAAANISSQSWAIKEPECKDYKDYKKPPDLAVSFGAAILLTTMSVGCLRRKWTASFLPGIFERINAFGA